MPSEERNAALKPSSTPGKGVVVIIGSGFGGSVVARRLAQANQHLSEKLTIYLLERGRRYEPEDFPRLQIPESLTKDEALRSSKRLPEAARLSWMNDQGLWQIRDLRGLRVAVAAGYGGGSLIYACVHLRPPDSVFKNWPEFYRRKNLDCYYRLVEAMLDARPAPPSTWIKTQRMASVAKQLGREKFFFYPPIAVTFADPGTSTDGTDETRDNGFGVQQRSCIGCGDCIIGCRHRAKNTLDLNYLAGIEGLGVHVRTLTEAIAIERVDSGKMFRVRYRDHLRGAKEDELDAEYVFVCAGAIGSTELLFRSKEKLAPEPTNTGLKNLGEHFFANGDAPGVIFDTKQPWQPSKGPTITTCLYQREKEQWFLLQEGGIPPTLERGLGFMRSPLWLGRNAFLGDTPAAAWRPGTDGLLEWVQKLVHFLQMPSRTPADGNPSLLPENLSRLLHPIERPRKWLKNRLQEMDHGVVERLIKIYQARFGVIPGSLLGFFIRHIASGHPLLEATLEDMAARFPVLAPVSVSTSPVSLGIYMAIEAALGLPPTEKTAILLAMGPDAHWQLHWNTHDRRLSAKGNMAANVDLYGLQERLMRDVREQLHGDLRTNPTWTLGHRPVTVHAQGGCSMANTEEGVTEPDGLMVRGIPGLYVFDGSVFPSSVGVNPSSTIAAVAERNIEIFVRKTLGRTTPRLEEWCAVAEEMTRAGNFRAQLAAKQEQWDQGPGRVLDDPEPLPAPAAACVPILKWSEVMEGFIDDSEPIPPLPCCPHTDEDTEVAQFIDLERKGQKRLRHIRADLTAETGDLEKALLTPNAQRFTITGTLQIFWNEKPLSPARKPNSYVAEGVLRINLREPGAAVGSVGSMTYVLKATPKGGGDETLELHGVKLLHEDPRIDAWQELTTLYSVVTRERAGEAKKEYGGILRVPLLDFIQKQLPSIDVVGKDISPARKSWLMLRFFRTFYRGLENIYQIGEL